MQTIDITPSWEAIAPLLCVVLEDGTQEGRRAAREELMRMARLADKYVEQEKTK